MNGSLKSNQSLLEGLKAELATTAINSEVIILPPFVYLAQVRELLADTGIKLGAQTVSEYEMGAYTGEINAAMLADMGCQYVIVGHSERRQLYAENHEIVARKFLMAHKIGLTPILCVGETQDERSHGLAQEIVKQQVLAVLNWVGEKVFKQGVIAYEPLWAIGTGKTATPLQAQEMHAYIRGLLANVNATLAQGMSILYGGSVKATNAAELFAQPDIDGALVGSASLDPKEFATIARAR